MSKGLNELAEEIHQTAVEKGWWDKPRSFGEEIALIHSEVSEALQAYRVGTDESIPSELADIIIRVLDTTAMHGIDIEKAVMDKMSYNKTRPYRHGGKRL